MTSLLSIRLAGFLAFLGSVYLLAAVLALRTTLLHDSPVLGAALAFDLAVTVPAAYLLLGRRRWPRWRAALLALAGAWAAARLVPGAEALRPEIWLGALEALVLGVIVLRVSAKLRRVRSRIRGRDLLDLLREEARSWTGLLRIADVLAWELATAAYAFTRARPVGDAPGVFGYTRRSEYDSLSTALLVLLAVEILPVHLLLHSWSPPVAWTVLALSLYGALWILGDRRSRPRRPVELTPEGIRLRAGIRWDAFLPWEDVASVRALPEGPATGRTLRATVHDPPEIEIALRRPLPVTGAYGMRRIAEWIAIRVDDRERFLAEAAAHLGEGS